MKTLMLHYKKSKQQKMKRIMTRKTYDSKTYHFSIKLIRICLRQKRLSLKLNRPGNNTLVLLSVISIEK
jgi:hypothetical protein